MSIQRLADLADEIESLQSRFKDSSSSGKFLATDDQATFKGLTVQAKAALDSELGIANDFSLNLVASINSGSGGFLGGPSYVCVGEVVALIRGAVDHLQRSQISSPGDQLRISDPYVDPGRIAALQAIRSTSYDYSRLAQMLGELNVADQNDCNIATAMLVRSIIDHVPPLFSKQNFSGVANNYGDGGQSFKRSMQNLERSLRHIADRHLHQHIRSSESIPAKQQVNFKADLDVLLGEILRLAEGS